MSKLLSIKTIIEDIFKSSRFAVLATEGDGKPHASLVAITPMEGFSTLIFATYRNTQKYQNLLRNHNVAVLVENIDINRFSQHGSVVLTANGHVEDIEIAEKSIIFGAHLARHPELLSFMQSANCSLVRIKVDKYQIVRGIEDVEWWTLDDLNAPLIK